MAFKPHFFNPQSEEQELNSLLQYLQEQHPEVLSQIANNASADVRQIIAQNVQGLVGMLPTEEFKSQITTDRENLATLLASAMMTGYFLRQMEQRMELDTGFSDSSSL